MNIIFKLLLFLATFLMICVGILYTANEGKLDKQLKQGLHYYFKLNGINVQFQNCHFKNGLFTASNAKVKLGSGLVSTTNLQVKLDILGKWDNPKLNIDIAPAAAIIWDKHNKIVSQIDITSKISKHLLTNNSNYFWDIQNIQIPNIKDINQGNLGAGTATCRYRILKDNQDIDCSLNFGETTKVSISNIEPDKPNLQIIANNIPLRLYELLDRMSPNHRLLNFLEKFIKEGYIQDARIVFDPQSKKVEDTLFGAATITKLDLRYNAEYPILKNMDVNVDIKGPNVQFFIDKAYSSDVLLSDGTIIMDWKGLDDTTLIIQAKGTGPAKGLADFISSAKREAMAKANIDFHKIKGIVDLDIKIKIPLKPNTKNIYNISAIIPNASLNIFKDNLLIRKANINGVFNGDQVLLSSKSKINDFDSDLDFIYNVTDESKFNHKLDIKTTFKAKSQRSKQNTKIAFIDLLRGESSIDLQYINKDSQGYISIDSDISQLELYFDKLALHKKQNDQSRLIANGIFQDPNNGSFDFSVKGSDSLNINGSILIKDDLIETNIHKIQTKNTDLSANIAAKKNSVIASLKGKKLDLSKSNMLQFFEKESDNIINKIRLNIDNVLLKNNIILSNLNSMFKCNSDRCTSGFLDAKIGSRSVEVLLSTKEKQQEWLIKCSNAGALLRGLGLYESMKAGNLTLNISTNRQKTADGTNTSILNGTFTLERFVLSDTPIMSRIVSFVSLPGFINLIRGNKDIIFSDMNGGFRFADNILTIKNSVANGPYLDFKLKGDVDIKNRLIDIQGHVTPELYGVSSVLGRIPVIGSIFTGNKKQHGIISAPYHIKDSY